MPQKRHKSRKNPRPPRICVPNSERALFIVDEQKFVGVVQRLSLTGGSVILSKGPIAEGTVGQMGLKTVCGPMRAQIQFLHRGADGIPLAQAFRFLEMDAVSRKRFETSVKKMEQLGFSDSESNSLTDLATQTFSRLGESIRRLSALVGTGKP